MTTLQDRLVRAEKRLKDLTDNVASLYRSRLEFLDTHGLDLVKAQNIAGIPLATGDKKALNALTERVRKLEVRVDSLVDELGDFMVDHRVEREARARASEADEQEALGTLAKAQNASRRRETPEGLLERADRAVSDPVAVGMVASYINLGQFAKAAAIVEDAEKKIAEQDEDAAHDRVEQQVKQFDTVAAVSELSERVVAFERTLTSLLGRLSRLETRPTGTPAPTQTVAKAAQGRRQAANTVDPRETSQGLLVRAEGVIDSPARVGYVSSLVQAGQLDAARAIIEKAELQHEADLKKRERRTL